VIEHLSVSLPHLPHEFDGLTVAAIADLHAGLPWRLAPAVRRTVELVNSHRPDVILLLGDIVHRLPHAPAYLELLSDLRAAECIYATLGNHEHEYRWTSRWMRGRPLLERRDWERLYAAAGIPLLVDEARALTRGAARLWFVGIDDCHSGHGDLPAALQSVPADECCIGFTHHPDLLDHPLTPRLDLLRHVSCRHPEERAAGWVEHRGMLMYVTRGAGEGVPLRMRCPRQIPIFTLHSGERQGDGGLSADGAARRR